MAVQGDGCNAKSLIIIGSVMGPSVSSSLLLFLCFSQSSLASHIHLSLLLPSHLTLSSPVALWLWHQTRSLHSFPFLSTKKEKEKKKKKRKNNTTCQSTTQSIPSSAIPSLNQSPWITSDPIPEPTQSLPFPFPFPFPSFPPEKGGSTLRTCVRPKLCPRTATTSPDVLLTN